MRESESYAAFERRWQLPVYYQLRWKEIVSGFEASLTTPGTAGEWALPQTSAAWKALQTCWDDDVYIPELANRFWRLSLQVSDSLEAKIDGRLWRDTALGSSQLSMDIPLMKRGLERILRFGRRRRQ